MTNSRRKGAVGELQARDFWRRWFPNCKRSIGQVREGYEYPDLVGDNIEDHFWIEVKFYAKITESKIWDWWDKIWLDYTKYCKARDDDYDVPVVLQYRENNGSWIFMMLEEDGEQLGLHCPAWEVMREEHGAAFVRFGALRFARAIDTYCNKEHPDEDGY